jgi:alkanesulfonate monooxygenase SsuD/methylene tetrahydromethanopterin reductase-like flavin-dependent oxidoreductase (luciferase family)
VLIELDAEFDCGRQARVALEFALFLPQMRLPLEELVRRARAAETAGFSGIAGMDHLVPPLALEQPMYEAMVTNTWLAAHTERLRIGSLVLCDAFRHPAVLAREAVSIDHASGGRFELGMGWGSVPDEFATFGVGDTRAAARIQRFRETLEILRALWAGETVDYDGRFHRLRGARQEPLPLRNIPIVIGGVGPKTLALVREFADWWNVMVGHVDRLDELRAHVGAARVSVQHVVGFVPAEAEREAVTSVAKRRFGYARPAVGTAAELVDHFGRLAERGVERVYTWFSDFAVPDTLAAFGECVIAPLAR